MFRNVFTSSLSFGFAASWGFASSKELIVLIQLQNPINLNELVGPDRQLSLIGYWRQWMRLDLSDMGAIAYRSNPDQDGIGDQLVIGNVSSANEAFPVSLAPAPSWFPTTIDFIVAVWFTSPALLNDLLANDWLISWAAEFPSPIMTRACEAIW